MTELIDFGFGHPSSSVISPRFFKYQIIHKNDLVIFRKISPKINLNSLTLKKNLVVVPKICFEFQIQDWRNLMPKNGRCPIYREILHYI